MAETSPATSAHSTELAQVSGWEWNLKTEQDQVLSSCKLLGR